MTFLALPFLAGLIALAVPIIIHLIQSPRARIVHFPTIRLLKNCQKRASRRARLKHLLLLLLRMALLALIVLAMAKPWINPDATAAVGGSANPVAPVSMVIVLDNSYSMSFVDRGSSRFDRARRAAGELVETLKPGDDVAVVLMNEQAVPYVRELTTDHERVKQALHDAELSVLGTNAEPALREAVRMLARPTTTQPGSEAARGLADGTTATTADPSTASSPPRSEDDPKAARRREVYILTDLQAQSWKGALKSDLFRHIETKAAFYVLNLGRPNSPNCFIESAAIGSSGSDEAVVTAQVRASGAGNPSNLITLSVNGKNVAQETFAVRQDTPTAVSLTGHFGQQGTYRCVLSLQQDDLPIDDRYSFTVEVGQRSSVMVVDGAPSAVPSLSETFYLSAALNPSLATGGKPMVDVRIVGTGEFSAASLEGYRCVVLCNLAKLDGGDLLKLENFIREGGGLLVFLGDNVTAEQYNTWQFLPLALTQPAGDPARKQPFTMEQIRAEHLGPLRQIDLRSARFFTCFGSDPGTLKQSAAILSSFSNGQPALVEGRFGRGKVLLLTSTSDTDWNNFPLRRGYVPWVHQVVQYLSNQGMTVRAFHINQEVAFQALASEYKKSITVTDPAGRKIVLRPEVVGGNAQATYKATALPGLYQVDADAAFSNAGGFGVNLDTTESVLEPANPEEIITAAPAGMIRFLDPAGPAVVRQVQDARQGKELWPLLFMLAALLFLFESFFGNLIARAGKVGAAGVEYFDVLKRRGLSDAQTTRQ